MKRTMRSTAPLLFCAGLLAAGCDDAVDSDQLDGNEFTEMSSLLQRVDAEDAAPIDPNVNPDGQGPTLSARGFGSLQLGVKEIFAAKLDAGDLDDLVVQYHFGSCVGCGVSVVTLNPEAARVAPSVEPSRRMYGVLLEPVDLDADGRSELVNVDIETGEVRVYDAASGKVSARLGEMPCLTATSGPHIVGSGPENIAHYRLADVNGDGRADIVCVGKLAEGRRGKQSVITVHFAQTDQLGFSDATEHRWSGWLRDMGDFDGDGQLDYLVQQLAEGEAAENPAAFTLRLAVAYGDGSGSFSEPQQVHENAELMQGTVLAVADFDGDGADDIIWRDDLSSCQPELQDKCGEVRNGGYFANQAEPAILFGNEKRGVPFVHEPFALNLSAGPETLSYAADLDGDGAAELVQVGPDRELGIEIEPFLRVMRVVDGTPIFISSTRLAPYPHYPQEGSLSMGGINYRLAVGHFQDDGQSQLLVVETRMGDDTLYRWTNSK